ncbi:ABC transporter related protein [Acidilobus saccharovorans 345-15]|uniref:ABC transporter related protein n=1 Tax=Acidilobus saccharovorans (strain DSM 16705 / JCM 18335 / VKM B-2471 / 345-15) TaxID=666510 RepID=D9PZE1_ACIS3|nr:ABC transporter related protein [Acidilobus saccharovorans 345-15]
MGSPLANAIEVRDVVKFYGTVPALRGLSFEVPEGGRYALLGPNGAGKSTTLRLLVGLMKPDRGEVRVLGRDPADDYSVKAQMGYLPEDATPYLALTVRENLEYIAALRGLDDPRDRAEKMMDLLGLRKYENYRVSALSRGNVQKLAIALAIIHEPKVVFLDEPLNYLDIPTQEEVIGVLSRMGSTMLVSTHIMSVAGRLTDHILMISGGRLVWQGTFDDLRRMAKEEEPVESVVARLMRSVEA